MAGDVASYIYFLSVLIVAAALEWFVLALIQGFMIYVQSWWERYIELPIVLALDIYVVFESARRLIRVIKR